MRCLLLLLLLLQGLVGSVFAQKIPVRRTAEEFGYRHLVVMFGRDSVNVLVQSKKGEEQLKKPLLLWVQGSLPTPLILVDDHGPYRTFPFASRAGVDALAAHCHLAIIGKPGVALVADVEGQNPNQMFSTGPFPAYYCARNYLDYYVRRETAVLRYLKKQPWVDARRVLVGGHSQGSGVVAQLAAVPGLVSGAIYLSGNPLGRILTQVRRGPTDTDSTTLDVEARFADWQRAVAHPADTDCSAHSDTNKNVFSFGQSELPALLRARVPIFVGYGTRDAGAVANDYLRLEAIRLHKTNFTFRAYVGREHNFFGFKNGQIDYKDDYWDKVGADFLRWAGLLPGPR